MYNVWPHCNICWSHIQCKVSQLWEWVNKEQAEEMPTDIHTVTIACDHWMTDWSEVLTFSSGHLDPLSFSPPWLMVRPGTHPPGALGTVSTTTMIIVQLQTTSHTSIISIIYTIKPLLETLQSKRHKTLRHVVNINVLFSSWKWGQLAHQDIYYDIHVLWLHKSVCMKEASPYMFPRMDSSVHLASLFSCFSCCGKNGKGTHQQGHTSTYRDHPDICWHCGCVTKSRGVPRASLPMQMQYAPVTHENKHTISTRQQSTLNGQDARINYKGNPQSTELPAQTVELRIYMFPKY